MFAAAPIKLSARSNNSKCSSANASPPAAHPAAMRALHGNSMIQTPCIRGGFGHAPRRAPPAVWRSAAHHTAGAQWRRPAPPRAAAAQRSAAAPMAQPSAEEALSHVLRNGTGVARRVLSDPAIEGDPLAFLKATEAYWKVRHPGPSPGYWCLYPWPWFRPYPTRQEQ
jgi:hypothetical protein